MKLGLRIDFTDSAPRWMQIRDGLMRLVLRGTLSAGSPVPSQREIARSLGVNPATVAKAYQRLDRAGVFAVRRGNGTFVSESAATSGKRARRRMLREGALRFADFALAMGADARESLQELESAFRRLASKRSPGPSESCLA